MAQPAATFKNAFIFVKKEGAGLSALTKIGMVTGVSFQVNLQVTEMRVIGHFYPVSQDVQGYEATMSIEAFYPRKNLGKLAGDGKSSYAEDEAWSPFDFIPTKSEIESDDGSYKIDEIMLKSTDNNTTLLHLKGAVPESSNMSVQAQGYMTGGVTFRAIMPVEDK